MYSFFLIVKQKSCDLLTFIIFHSKLCYLEMCVCFVCVVQQTSRGLQEGFTHRSIDFWAKTRYSFYRVSLKLHCFFTFITCSLSCIFFLLPSVVLRFVLLTCLVSVEVQAACLGVFQNTCNHRCSCDDDKNLTLPLNQYTMGASQLHLHFVKFHLKSSTVTKHIFNWFHFLNNPTTH